MPTVMKKSPSRSPLNGSMSASSSCRNSESASSSPARNAPSDIDTPIVSMMTAEPITSSSAAAVNTSGLPWRRDELQRRAHEQAAGRDEDHDRAERLGRDGPVTRVLQRRVREQRQQRDQRNHDDVLEEQHGERLAAVVRAELPALGERREHERGRRHRQPETRDDRGLPRKPEPRREQAEHEPR